MTLQKRYINNLIEYFKYCIVGISCAVIDLAVLNVLLYFYPTKQISWLTFYNSSAYGLAVFNSYIWNSKYTFKVKKNMKQFIAFIGQAAASLFIANFIFILGLWLFGMIHELPIWMQTNIAKAISMFLSSLASFFFNKLFVFRKKSLKKVQENRS